MDGFSISNFINKFHAAEISEIPLSNNFRYYMACEFYMNFYMDFAHLPGNVQLEK